MPGMADPEPTVAALRAMPFFGGLDDPTLMTVAQGTRSRKFKRGEVIFHLGDPGDGLFFIVSGAVRIVLPGESGDAAILATLEPGQVFGELALLDGAPRSATATAIEPTEAIVLSRERFRELLATEESVRDALLAAVATEIRRLTAHVEELHFLDVTGRLAACLTRLAGSGTRTADGAIRLRAPLTQGDLAAMVGCTRQSVNKLLGQFAADGLVRLEKDTVAVLDLAGLQRTAHR